MKQRRYTKQRKMVYDAVQSRHDHPSADSIYLDVRRQDDKISRGTVYRNLKLLSESGDVAQVELPDADRFDSRTDRHYHLVCVRCGKVCDAPIDYCSEYDQKAEEESGFLITRHQTVFEGLCSECRKKDTEG